MLLNFNKVTMNIIQKLREKTNKFKKERKSSGAIQKKAPKNIT